MNIELTNAVYLSNGYYLVRKGDGVFLAHADEPRAKEGKVLARADLEYFENEAGRRLVGE